MERINHGEKREIASIYRYHTSVLPFDFLY